AFSPDGRFLVGGGLGRVTIWDARTGQIVRTIHDPDGEQASPSARIGRLSGGKILLARVCHTGSTLFWWEFATGNRLASCDEGQYALDVIALSPNGACIAAGGRGFLTERGSVLLLFDQPDGKPTRRWSFVGETL